MTLYERYNIGEDAYWMLIGDYMAGQTFTIGNTGTNESHYITSVKLLLFRRGYPGAGTVAIYATANGLPTGNPLCQIDYDFNNLPTAYAEWIEFTFAPALLSASTQYAIVISSPDSIFNNNVRWWVDSTNSTYTGGCRVCSEDGGSSWYSRTWDAMFEVYGTAPPPSGPHNFYGFVYKGQVGGLVTKATEIIIAFPDDSMETGFTGEGIDPIHRYNILFQGRDSFPEGQEAVLFINYDGVIYQAYDKATDLPASWWVVPSKIGYNMNIYFNYVSPCDGLDETSCNSSPGCFWYGGACYETFSCFDVTDETQCWAEGCYWWYSDGKCKNIPEPGNEPMGEILDFHYEGTLPNITLYWTIQNIGQIAGTFQAPYFRDGNLVQTVGCAMNPFDTCTFSKPATVEESTVFEVKVQHTDGTGWDDTAILNIQVALDLCSWVSNKGGPVTLTIPNVFEIVDAYLFSTPPTGYTFIPTLQNVFGVVDYYLGFNGDPLTGCFFFT